MAVVTWPADIQIGGFDAAVEYDVQLNVMRNGSITTYGLPGARWTSVLSFEPDVEQLQRPRVEALIVSLEGGANRLQMHHHGRPIPNGSLRGSPTVNNNAAAGAKQIAIANANGTLKRGDLIGVLGQLLMIVADASPVSNILTVEVRPALRVAVTAGSAVIWNKPAINWIPRSSIAGPFPYRQAKVRPGFSCEFVEAY